MNSAENVTYTKADAEALCAIAVAGAVKVERDAIIARIATIGADWRAADSHFKADACDYLVRDLREKS